MAMKNRWNVMLVILVVVIGVWGKPKCRRRFVTDVVCVAGNDDYKLTRGLVSDNNNIEAIKMRDCRITEVDIEAFKNSNNIAEIDLSRNKISSLKKETFYGNPKLRNLNLSQNLLAKLPLGLFDQSPRLQNFEIADNKITSLEVGLFENAPNLINFGIASNEIIGKDLDPSFFEAIPNLVYLHMSGNNMSHSPDNLLQPLQKLRVLELNDCSLTEVPKFATSSNLHTVERLLLQSNNIRDIEDPATFVNMANLEMLFLIHNVINNLHADVLKPLIKLKFVDLSFNKIERIPDSLFSDMMKLRAVDLSNNFIEKVPLSAFYGTGLETLRLNANRISFLDSNFCEELRRTSNRLSIMEFQENPFQCACLLEILNEAKKFDIKYNTDKYNGEEPVCFMTNEFSCLRHEFELEYEIDVRQLASKTTNTA